MLLLLGKTTASLPDIDALLSRLPAQWISAWEARHGATHRKSNTIGVRQSLGGLLLLAESGAIGELHYEDSGKPHLSISTSDFSITHTDGLVLCAIEHRTDGGLPHVGIDAENLTRVATQPFERLAARWFTEGELAQFSASPNSETFARIWTRKEAMVKYQGAGLSKLHDADTACNDQSRTGFTEYREGEIIITLCHDTTTPPPYEIKYC